MRSPGIGVMGHAAKARARAWWLGAAAAALAAGCASREAATGTIPADAGFLRVYSAYETRADFSELDRARRRHSDYRVSAVPDGKPLRVRNDTPSAGEGPAAVPLAPGEYHVRARANGHGDVDVPVRIEAGRTTSLHLEGARPPGDGGEPARTAGGEVVGWVASGR